MANLNRVFLIGNLTRDPELRHLASGTSVADMRMAINRRYKQQNGELKEETCFVDVAAWGREAENCAKYLRKGSRLFVEGRLQFDQWEKEGRKQSKLSVVCERCQFLDPPRRPEYGADAPEGGAEPRAEPRAEPPGPEEPGPGPAPQQDVDNLPF